MKHKFSIAALFVILSASLYAQGGSIHNTIAEGGSFTVKDGAATFLSLSQSTGHLSLNKSLTLPVTTSGTLGVIFKGADRFIHDYQAPGTDGFNTFVGVNSGNFPPSANGVESSHNTAIGNSSLSSFTTGYYNSALGYRSLYSTTTGHYNSAFGNESLFSNTTGRSNSAFGLTSLYSNFSGSQNSAFGVSSLQYNTTGYSNSAFGFRSLYYNSTGYYNSAFGNESLVSNTTGNYNSAFGFSSLYFNKGTFNSAFGYESLLRNATGEGNSAFGVSSLFANTTGDNNTALGYNAGRLIITGHNNIAIGYNAQVPSGTANNQVRIGDFGISYAGIQVAWTITSDKRWKEDILPLNLGLEFISKLNPVSYIRKNDEKRRTEYGFIAQEIEEVLDQQGVDTPGMITIVDKGYYELRYNDLLAPMVKAIQELKTENDALRKEIAALHKSIADQVKKEVHVALQREVGSKNIIRNVSLNEPGN